MLSISKVPPPPPILKVDKDDQGVETPSGLDINQPPKLSFSDKQPPFQQQLSLPSDKQQPFQQQQQQPFQQQQQPFQQQQQPFQPNPQTSPKTSPKTSETEKLLSDTLNSIRVPKINREWKKCISEIEKVINKKPTSDEFNNPSTRRNIEYYKDRLGKDLYECKVNQKKKEDEDKKVEQMKRQKAQEDFEKKFEMKYNLKPQEKQSSTNTTQQPNTTQQSNNIQTQMNKPSPAFGLEMEQKQDQNQITENVKPEKKEKGFFDSIFGSNEDEEEEDTETATKEELVDTINMYLKSQDPNMPQPISLTDVKGVDNLISRFEELVENHDILDLRFQKYKESQKVKNAKDNALILEQEDTINNLTSVVNKLEKTLKDYRSNAEKKFMAQEQLHQDNIKKLEKEKNEESKTVHKYMQDILNERIDSANKIIQDLTNDTNKAIKVSKKVKIPKKEKKTKKKKKGKKSKKSK